MGEIKGRCLCGAVQYSTKAEPKMVAICHCLDCQRQSGGAFSVNVLVPIDEVEMTGESLAQYVIDGDTGTSVVRNFCNNCGSPLSTELEAFGNLAAIKAGTLDDSSWVKPSIQIWCDNSQPWGKLDGDIKKAPQNPL